MEDEDIQGAPLIAFVDVMAVILSLLLLIAGAAALHYQEGQAAFISEQKNIESLQKKIDALEAHSAEQIRLLEELRGKKIIIPNEIEGRVFFDSGSARIRSEFLPLLDSLSLQLWALLQSGDYNLVQIVGHTDNDPISSWDYRDNWELGAARALSVLRYLQLKGIPLDQLSVSSRGEFSPLIDGQDSEAKSYNRRIELIIIKE